MDGYRLLLADVDGRNDDLRNGGRFFRGNGNRLGRSRPGPCFDLTSQRREFRKNLIEPLVGTVEVEAKLLLLFGQPIDRGAVPRRPYQRADGQYDG
jgi:hypothetical protein